MPRAFCYQEAVLMPAPARPLPAASAATLALFFASGFAGLVYQVLWRRELGLLFGNGSHATAATLAAFFLGLAAGGAAFGRRAERTARPLLGYAALEAAVAASALAWFGLLDLFHSLYPFLYDWLGDHRAGFVAARFGLALAVLFPPAFCLGGTLPLLSQHLVREPAALGRTAALAYAVNTLGAATGAFAAAFVLVPRLGVRGAYATALATTLAVAALAAGLGRRALPPPPPAAPAPSPPAPLHGVRSLAVLSGFAVLALEVLWTRMFAQVLHNSVYTFAVILVIFLLALAIGAAIARGLARRVRRPAPMLVALLAGGALGVAATPFAFDGLTDGLRSLGEGRGFAGYLAQVFGAGVLVVGVPTVWLGVLFPYLIKLGESWGYGAGRTVGELAAWNTLGGVAGSLAAGFVLLEWLGLWNGLRAVAALQLVGAAAVAGLAPRRRLALAAAPAAGLALLATAFDASRLPGVHIDPARGERVVEILEGSDAVVAVVDRPDSLRIKLDNHYGLGGSGDFDKEARQAHLPLLLHPAPRSAFFLGLGTGITAGAALQHPLERLLVAELVPDVATASRRYFGPWQNGLFADPRAAVRVEDGRNLLRGTRERFDVIVADLFVPWRAGEASLYAREHFAAARERLAEGGVFAQWLFLIQFSREEFGSVARSLVEVFPRVTLWRGNQRTTHPLVLLLGERDPAPLDASALERRIAETARTPADRDPRRSAIPRSAAAVLWLYQGDLSAARELLAEFPVNTDDRPFVEYSAPVTHRQKRTGAARAFTGRELIEFYDAVFAASPPETDPVLAGLAPALRERPRAGLEFYRARVRAARGEP
jgi:spermidine synthase